MIVHTRYLLLETGKLLEYESTMYYLNGGIVFTRAGLRWGLSLFCDIVDPLMKRNRETDRDSFVISELNRFGHWVVVIDGAGPDFLVNLLPRSHGNESKCQCSAVASETDFRIT